MPATSLRVRVARDGEQVVQLTFAAAAVGHLQELVPAEMLDRVRAHGIDIRQVSERAIAEGYQPGELFVLDDGGRTVRVWLE